MIVCQHMEADPALPGTMRFPSQVALCDDCSPAIPPAEFCLLCRRPLGPDAGINRRDTSAVAGREITTTSAQCWPRCKRSMFRRVVDDIVRWRPR